MTVLAVSDAVANIQSAVIAAIVSVVVAGIGWLSTTRRDRQERAYQRRRTALLDVQDAALTLRQAMQDYGHLIRRNPGSRPPELVDAERAFDHARGLLDVTISRVENRALRELVAEWRGVAQVTSISVQDDVSPPDEEASWSRLNRAVGQALSDKNVTPS